MLCLSDWLVVFSTYCSNIFLDFLSCCKVKHHLNSLRAFGGICLLYSLSKSILQLQSAVLSFLLVYVCILNQAGKRAPLINPVGVDVSPPTLGCRKRVAIAFLFLKEPLWYACGAVGGAAANSTVTRIAAGVNVRAESVLLFVILSLKADLKTSPGIIHLCSAFH